jgi:two-component system, OmpR family, response regulator QseB
MRVLIVEDDTLLGDGLASGLRSLGMAVDWFDNGQDADAALVVADYDAVLLDLGLPGRDGLAWLARWRARGIALPVLILTARDALEQRIAGLDGGADDYLVKPVEIAELAARLRAVRRRVAGRSDSLWTHGPLSYRPDARTALWHDQPVELTTREASLLELLLANPQRVLPRALIDDKLHGFGFEPESNTLEVHIHHLRRKLHPKLVRTVRGVGYALGTAEELQ